jgi:hypothetical protein
VIHAKCGIGTWRVGYKQVIIRRIVPISREICVQQETSAGLDETVTINRGQSLVLIRQAIESIVLGDVNGIVRASHGGDIRVKFKKLRDQLVLKRWRCRFVVEVFCKRGEQKPNEDGL